MGNVFPGSLPSCIFQIKRFLGKYSRALPCTVTLGPAHPVIWEGGPSQGQGGGGGGCLRRACWEAECLADPLCGSVSMVTSKQEAPCTASEVPPASCVLGQNALLQGAALCEEQQPSALRAALSWPLGCLSASCLAGSAGTAVSPPAMHLPQVSLTRAALSGKPLGQLGQQPLTPEASSAPGP